MPQYSFFMPVMFGFGPADAWHTLSSLLECFLGTIKVLMMLVFKVAVAGSNFRDKCNTFFRSVEKRKEKTPFST